MGVRAARRCAAGATAGAVMLMVLFGCASQTGPAGTTWAGEDSNEIFRVLEMRPDGEFVSTSSHYPGFGTWRRDGDALVMETGKGNTRYEARIVDGRLVGRGWQPNTAWKASFDYGPAQACAGERKICGNQAFCVDPKRKRSLNPIPALATDPAAGDEGFGAFHDAFRCSIELGLKDAYADNIAFPLALRELSDDPAADVRYHRLGDKLAEQRQVGRRDFSPGDIAGEPGFPVNGKVPAGLAPEGGVSTLTHWGNGARSSIWTFRPEGGRWRLTESASCTGDSCPGVLYCGDPRVPPRYPDAGPGGEDFNAFFRAFYCASKAGDDAMMAKRVVFPFPYSVADTEGEQSRRAGRKEFGELYLFVGDGNEMPPGIRVSGNEASIGIDWFGTGMGVGLEFKRVTGKWRLTRGDFAGY